MTVAASVASDELVDYTVVFRTADKSRAAGTGTSVLLAAKEGDQYVPFKCTSPSQEHKSSPFKRGFVDTFTFRGPSMDPKYVKLKREGTGMELTGWILDDMSITNMSTGQEAYFPVFRYLTLNRVYNLLSLDIMTITEVHKVKCNPNLPESRRELAAAMLDNCQHSPSPVLASDLDKIVASITSDDTGAVSTGTSEDGMESFLF